MWATEYAKTVREILVKKDILLRLFFHSLNEIIEISLYLNNKNMLKIMRLAIRN